MNVHPVAEMFPLLSKDELQELADDIKQNGLLQRIVLQGDTILDGRNRVTACRLAGVEPQYTQYGGDSPVSFIIASNLHRRHLTRNQKIALGIELEPHFAAEAKKRQAHGLTAPGKTLVENVPQASKPPEMKSRDQAAAAVGVSGKTISKVKAIKARAPEKFQEIVAGKKTVARVEKEIRAAEAKAALARAQAEIDAERRRNLNAVCDLRVCSCQELFASGIKPDAVITDPPYAQEYLPCFTELAQGCARAEVPLVAVMSGQSYLPEVLARLCEHLKYRWTMAYLTPGGQAVQQWQAKVNTTWKPILLFGKPTGWLGDVATSRVNDNDKKFHSWGQSETGTADLVERLSKPGQLICDPFLGGGTTAVVALALGRRFVGCDIDRQCVEQSRQRVEAAWKQQ